MINIEKAKNKKIKIGIIGQVILLVLGILSFVIPNITKDDRRAIMAQPIPLVFHGEYSLNGEEWKEYVSDTDLRASKGELLLRGTLEVGSEFGGGVIPEGFLVNFHMNHIGIRIILNEEEVFMSGCEADANNATLCANDWTSWSIPAIAEGEKLEIHLINHHAYGNAGAYNEFLNEIYGGDYKVIENVMDSEYKYDRMIGSFCVVVSLLILGMALMAKLTHNPLAGIICPVGMLSFFAGIFIVLDTPDVIFYTEESLFNTWGRQISIIFSAFSLGLFTRKLMKTKAAKVAETGIVLSGTLIGILLAMTVSGWMIIYDTVQPFIISQMIFVPFLLVAICYEIWKRKGEDCKILLLTVLLYLAEILEILNYYTDWWISGRIAKVFFVLCLMILSVWAFRNILDAYRKSQKTKQLEEELQNSRLVLSMSQIRSHFIFNVLNAISGMCKYNPEKADETITRFARHLRSNVNVMQKDTPILFSKELQNVEDYVVLEQIRFGEKIRFTSNIRTQDFLIPPLVLQPLVENSIKHGIMKKPEGGNITLEAYKKESDFIITICDDGVGFEEENEETGIALSNVRFRLEYMMKGTMTVESRPSIGTKVTIVLPGEEAMKCM